MSVRASAAVRACLHRTCHHGAVRLGNRRTDAGALVPGDDTPVYLTSRRTTAAFVTGAAVGTLGGLIGLGGAEFRLPLLIGVFGFAALHAVIVNKAVSLVVVLVALPARALSLPMDQVLSHWAVAANLLAGSLAGAWLGASWATRLASRTLYRVLSALLALLAVVLLTTHSGHLDPLALGDSTRVALGVAAGLGIGLVAALMGVAGGELIIPTVVLLFGQDIKTAGSISLLVSVPTMLVGFARYSRDSSFSVLTRHRRFVTTMMLGSLAGTLIGGALVGVVSSAVLVPLLAGLLALSAAKVWRHL